MSKGPPYALIALALAQCGVFLWAVPGRHGIRVVLVTNLLLAALTLAFLVPLLPAELRYIWSGGATDWFDYKGTIWSSFEFAVLITALLSLFGTPMPAAVGWTAFAINFAITVYSIHFFLNFEFKCCGYL